MPCEYFGAIAIWCILAVGAVSASSAFTPSRIAAIGPCSSVPTKGSTHLPINSLNKNCRQTLHTNVFALRGGHGNIQLAGLVYDETSRAFDAWEWTAGLGAPAALVAGAVLVTLSDTREEMQPRKTDARWIWRSKQAFRFLMMSSFALEVVCIFVSTVTGTVVLSHPEVAKQAARVGYGSPIGLLHHHHELEYLTIQIGFLQGLLNWLLAVAIDILIPKRRDDGTVGETRSARRMNQCLASCLLTLVSWILAFYNHHLTFYPDYAAMLKRYGALFWQRYIWCRPVRPMAFIYVSGMVASVMLAIRAFASAPQDDEE